MKLLYFVDFNHFETHGKSVTGATYRKLPHGPYPDKVEKVIEKMEKSGLVREVKTNHKGYAQHRLITLNGKFDPAKFTGAELQTLERVAADWANATAAQIEAATHREAPGQARRTGKRLITRWPNTAVPSALNHWTTRWRVPKSSRTMSPRWRDFSRGAIHHHSHAGF